MKLNTSWMTVVAATTFGVAAMLTNAADQAYAGSTEQPTVVELFTSQGCFSCPPAERFLGELVKKPNVIGLEFHVDYWDQLVYGAAGKWKDAFSDAAYTERQRVYATRFPRGQTYTPQMVIDGRTFKVGSHKRAVLTAIRKVAEAQKDRITVSPVARSDGGLDIQLAATNRDAVQVPIWLVRYIRAATTKVRSGENKGKSLVSHNIVTSVSQVGVWYGNPLTVKLPQLNLKENEGCAILVQSERQGPILGAGNCPGASS